MRRALLVCLVGFAVIVAFGYAQTGPQSSIHSDLGLQPIVVADGVTASEIMLSSSSNIFLSTASSLNRVFELLPVAVADAPDAAATLTPIVGTGAAGSLGDGGSAISAQLSLLGNNLYQRSGIIPGRDGALYIADSENATIRYVAGPQSTEPGIIRSIAGRWGPQQNVDLIRPVGIALDRAGDLYIADNGTGSVDVLYASSRDLKSIAHVTDASSIAVTADGARAFVTSPQTSAVIAVNLHTGSLQSLPLAGGPSTSTEATGDSASSCSSSVPSQSSVNFCPSGIAVNGAGNIFVSDLWNGRVIRVDGHNVSQAVVLSGLNKPGALVFDSEGRNLYIVEQGLNRIIEAQGAGGTAGALTLSPASAAFPNEPIAGVSQQTQFTLTNGSSNSVSGISTVFVPTSPTSPSATNDFTQQSTSCPSVLAPNGSCTINVAFTPTSLGPLDYSMNVSDSAGDSAASTLSGTGDDFEIQLASGQLQEMSVVQGNSVTYRLQVVASGVFEQSGEQVSFLCPGNMPAHTTCTINPSSVKPSPGSSVPFSVTFHTSSNNVFAYLQGVNFSNLGLLFLDLGLTMTLAFSFGLYRNRLLLCSVGCMALLAFVGCHHATVTSTPTPPASFTMTVQGTALDSTGNPLNATRGTSIILDVLAK